MNNQAIEALPCTKLVISNGADADGGYNTLSMYVLL